MHLETFLDEFELLKLEIRLCTDMKVLSFKKQAEKTYMDPAFISSAYLPNLSLNGVF